MLFVLFRTMTLPCSLTDQYVAYNKSITFPLATSHKVLVTIQDTTYDSNKVFYIWLVNVPNTNKQQFDINHGQMLPAWLYCSVWEYDSTFLVYTSIEAFLVLLFTPCQVQFQLCLDLSDPMPTQPSSISILLPGYLSLLPLPVHFLLALQFDQQVLFQAWPPLAFLSWLPEDGEF